MTADQQRLAIEANNREARKFVELNEALERLSSNRDFRKVIKEGFFEKEAIRLVHLKSDPSFKTPERQADIIGQIDAIGRLSEYFRGIGFNANQALKAIELGEVQLEEMAEEELSGGNAQ
jgi:hypothetical protein